MKWSPQGGDRKTPVMDVVARRGNPSEIPFREIRGLNNPCRNFMFQHNVVPTDISDNRYEVLDRKTPTVANSLC